jgi:hypothetical protein
MSASSPIVDISNILEKVIAPSIQSQLFKTTYLLDWFKKNAGITKLDNNEFNVTLRVKRNPSVGALPATSTTLPTDMKNIHAQTTVPAKYVFGNLRFDDRDIEATKSDKGALMGIVEEYSDAMRQDFAKEMNRQLHSYGSAVLTLVNGAVSSSATVTVDSTDNLVEGQYVKCGAGTVQQISSIDSATQITLAAAISCDDNAAVVRYITSTVAADDMMGLYGIIDDGTNVATLQGITRASSPYWVASLDKTSEALTEADLMTQLLTARKYGSPDDELVILMGGTLFNKYGGLMTSASNSPRRINDSLDFNSGWLKLQAAGVPIVLDWDTPTGVVQIVNKNAVTLGQLTPISFMPGTNGVLSRVTGTTQWEAVLRFYGNLIAKNVRANAALWAKT